MKKLFFILFISVLYPMHAQVSHGGSPLFLFQEDGNSGLKSSVCDESLFIEMPPFNLDSILADDKLNESNMRGAFNFAYKFHRLIKRGVDGHNFTLADGTKVWQVGIRSKEAYSINLFFSEYRIPRGGKLFLYNTDRSHILGSFTHENNSEGNILPTAPISGDEIIVEYSEPADVEFEGQLAITEINHDYRGVMDALAWHDCMPDVMCAIPDSAQVNSVVRLLVDGSYLCTGSLINNAGDTIAPYVLSAMHCLLKSDNLQQYTIDYYRNRAKGVVAMFNYQRPTCEASTNNNLSQSVAGTDLLCVVEKTDALLLKLKETPPDSYNSYYAGWNIASAPTGPFFNIHHPSGYPKRYGRFESTSISHGNWGEFFDSNIHWYIPGWTSGSTAGGSSGSPLFDKNGLIIGGLTGGASVCNGTTPGMGSPPGDYFHALYKSWVYSTVNDTLQLKHWLDPKNTGITSLRGRSSDGSSIEIIKKETTKITYLPESRRIIVSLEPNETGIVRIYSIHGACIYQQAIEGYTTFEIEPQLQNRFGIISLFTPQKVENIKVVL